VLNHLARRLHVVAGGLLLLVSGLSLHIGSAIAAPGNITEYPVPAPNATPTGIAAGPDGNMWFTEQGGNFVANVTQSGVFTEYPILTVNALPFGIAAGPDGNMWFTEGQANQVAKITPSGVITEYPIPTANSNPAGITAAPDGNLWFTESAPGANNVARVTPLGVVTEFPIPTTASRPQGIALGPDDNLWFTENAGNRVGTVTTAGAITEYLLPNANSLPYGIAAGPDGNLWVTEDGGTGQVAMVTTAGAVTEYAIPTANSLPGDITMGPDGNVWFTEGQANKVAEVTILGVVTEHLVPTASGFPVGIATGPDTNLWFTEGGGDAPANKVAKIQPTCPATTITPSWGPTAGGSAVTITGCGFNSSTSVMVAGAGSGATAQYVSPTTLTATMPPHPAGAAMVTVADPSPGAAVGSSVPYSYEPRALVAAVGSDNTLWQQQDLAGWNSPGGLFLAAPAVVSVPDTKAGAPLYIGVGADHDLWVRTTSHAWQPLDDLPVHCIDNPAATVSLGTLYVACQGADRRLYSAQGMVVPDVPPVFSRSSWTNLGGILSAGPAIAAIPGRGVDIMVVGLDKRAYEYYKASPSEKPSFHPDGFMCSGHPAIAATPDGTHGYFGCHGLDGALWSSEIDGTTNAGDWFNTASLGGQLIDGPGIAASGAGPTFYVEGLDHALYERGPFGGYRNDGGYIQYGTAAVAMF
jgi:streptogramin lyase